MRFRYIDEKGREVDLESVEALAARISLGAVRDDMELFDAVADRWAPAAEHEVFQQLKIEAGGGAASVSPLLGAVHSDPDDVAVERPRDVDSVEAAPAAEVPAPETPVDGGAPDVPAAEAEAAEPEIVETPEPEVAEPEIDILSSGGDMGLSLVGDGPMDTDGGPSSEPGGDGFDMGLDGFELALEPTGDEAVSREEDPPMVAEAQESGFLDADSLNLASPQDLTSDDSVDGLIGAGDYEMGAGSAPPMFGEEDSFEMEGFETGPKEPPSAPAPAPAPTPGWETPERPPLHPEDPADDEFITDRDPFAAPTDTGPDPSVEEERIRDEAGARKSAARAKAQERRQETGESDPADRPPPPLQKWNPTGLILVVAVAAVVVSGGTLLVLRQFSPVDVAGGAGSAGDAGAIAAPVLPAAPVLTAAEADALALGLDAGLSQALGLLDSLTAAAGLGDGPPTSWPRGQYLAEASSFPDVGDYFEASGVALQAMDSHMNGRLRSGAVAEMASAGMEIADADALFDRSGRWTLPLEADITTLVSGLRRGAASAVDLHSYLVLVEDRIDYDPFDQPGVSADPVVEAIPLDEEVEGEMWTRIGTVADEFRAVEVLRNGLPARMQALGDSIRATGR